MKLHIVLDFGLLIVGLSVFLSGCDGNTKKAKATEGSDNVARSYTKDKKLISELLMKDGKRHGTGKTYYRNGKVNLEMEYVEDKRVGKSRRFHESGLLYQETDYVNDQMHGKQKKFGFDGEVVSEATYEFNEPCVGLAEFIDGRKRSEYPTIKVQIIDNIELDGSYILRLSVTEGASTVTFYGGKLTASGCLHSALIPIAKGKLRNTAELRYDLFPGQFYMQELNFIAAITTRSGNTYLTQKTFPLSIEN